MRHWGSPKEQGGLQDSWLICPRSSSSRNEMGGCANAQRGLARSSAQREAPASGCEASKNGQLAGRACGPTGIARASAKDQTQKLPSAGRPGAPARRAGLRVAVAHLPSALVFVRSLYIRKLDTCPRLALGCSGRRYEKQGKAAAMQGSVQIRVGQVRRSQRALTLK